EAAQDRGDARKDLDHAKRVAERTRNPPRFFARNADRSELGSLLAEDGDFGCGRRRWRLRGWRRWRFRKWFGFRWRRGWRRRGRMKEDPHGDPRAHRDPVARGRTEAQALDMLSRHLREGLDARAEPDA